MAAQLLSVQRKRWPEGAAAASFPFGVPSLAALEPLDLAAPVTFFVGENGSGKSTLLEALAVAARLPAVGRRDPASDETLAAQRTLAGHLRLSWSRHRTHRGFFLRAEDFFGFAARLRADRAVLEARLEEIEVEFADASDYAKALARGPAAGSLHEMKARYGEDIDHQSHGESFLALLRSRLVPNGLYLLDEPEAALSPQSQLAFIAMVREAIDAGGQFIMATHSPILMAIPGAVIVSFDERPPRPVPFDQLAHVTLMRDFLAHPERFLRHLWG
ncbi:MAG: AAA family ATPase [Gemmatimonadetes bacterium]|nr:AAA family ATPase [Gemmatimonadota bacterium]